MTNCFSPTPSTFEETLSRYRARIDTTLHQLLPTSDAHDKHLINAMQYATLNAGKRLRPILVYATGSCLGQDLNSLDLVAAAIECMHCYSLIHDDLPAMDDDKLRRGKPTCHIAFDEATAILAGDALQTLAFECLLQASDQTISMPSKYQMLLTLARASGRHGMVAGQSLDLQAEGKTLSIDKLETIHKLKTGALFSASVLLGAYAANCEDTSLLKQFKQYADDLGLAFQLQDDLLDTIGESTLLGKHTGQDAKQQKATYTSIFGISATENRIATLTHQAISALKQIPFDTAILEDLCLYLMHRKK